MLKSLISYFINLRKIKNFNKHNKKHFKQSYKNNENVILLECNNACSNHIAYSYIANELSKKYNAKIISFKITLSSNIIKKLIQNINIYFDLFYFEIYKSFNSQKIISINDDIRLDKRIKFNSKNELLKFRYKGILVGDLIYDSYLRYNLKNSLDLNDPNFIDFTNKSINFFENSLDVFKKYKIKSVVMSHAVYLPAFLGRFAASKGLDNYCAGVTHLIRLTKKHLHLNNYNNYKKEFEAFSTKEKRSAIMLAKIEIKKKFI